MNRTQIMPLQNNFNQLNNNFMNMNLNNNQNFMNNNFNQMNNNMNIQSMNNMNNNLINELNQYKNENKQLKEQINNLQQKINLLNDNLVTANQNIINLQQQLFNYNNQVNNLNIQLMNKEKELDIIKMNKPKDGYVNYNNIMVVHFNSGDGKIDHGIKCLPTETFAEVEEKLYKIYDEYRETNNIFLAKGNVIKRFKKMSENNIQNGDKIQLQNFNE
jgi:uncharacterized coiled-coil DUF342 family protein